MTDHPAWRKARCLHCADGWKTWGVNQRNHLNPDVTDCGLHACTAPTEAEYIAELEAKLAPADCICSNPLSSCSYCERCKGINRVSDSLLRKRIAELEEALARLADLPSSYGHFDGAAAATAAVKIAKEALRDS